jgi:hypothetical protein
VADKGARIQHSSLVSRLLDRGEGVARAAISTPPRKPGWLGGSIKLNGAFGRRQDSVSGRKGAHPTKQQTALFFATGVTGQNRARDTRNPN